VSNKNKFKIVSLNFLKDRHGKLLKQIYDEAQEREMSVSAFCISIIKKYMAENTNAKSRDEI